MNYREAADILEKEKAHRVGSMIREMFFEGYDAKRVEDAYRMAIDMLRKEAYKTEHAETVYYKGVK